MSLASSLSKITKITESLTNSTPTFLVPFKIKNSVLNRILGLEEGQGEIESISDLANLAKESLDVVKYGVNLFRCGVHNIMNYNALIGQILGGLTQMAVGLAAEIFDAIQTQVQLAINQVVNTVFSLIQAIHSLWVSMVLLWNTTMDMLSSWFNWGEVNWDFMLDKENCDDMYSAIIACLLNKFLGPFVKKIKENTVGKINKWGEELNQELYEGLSDVKVISDFANREAFLLKKASIQIGGLTKQNLLS